MSLNLFIPEVWSARLLDNLHKVLVYGQSSIIGREYEGDIQGPGDTVTINSIGTVTVQSYAKNTDITAPEALTAAQTKLTISQAEYFNFAVDDVDQVQSKPEVMDGAMREASYALGNVADTFIGALYTDISSATSLGSDASPIAIASATPTDAYDNLVKLRVLLNKQNIPMQNRFVIVPPDFTGYLLRDQRFVGYGTQQNLDVLRNGYVGRAAGFDIYESNNCPVVSTTKFKVIAGVPSSWCYAEQINKVEAYRPEKRFSDAVKGLHLYGAKIIRPNGLAVMTCTFS